MELKESVTFTTIPDATLRVYMDTIGYLELVVATIIRYCLFKIYIYMYNNCVIGDDTKTERRVNRTHC